MYKNKKTIIFLALLLIFLVNIIAITPAQALKALNLKDAFGITDGNNDDPLDAAASAAGYDTSEAATKMDTIIGAIIQAALSILGVIFLVLMIYGGYMWMTAQGNEERVTKAKNLIIAAIIGLIIVIAAYAISYFVIAKLTATVISNTVK